MNPHNLKGMENLATFARQLDIGCSAGYWVAPMVPGEPEEAGCEGAGTPACDKALSNMLRNSLRGRAPSTSRPLINIVGVALTPASSPSLIEAFTWSSFCALMQD